MNQSNSQVLDHDQLVTAARNQRAMNRYAIILLGLATISIYLLNTVRVNSISPLADEIINILIVILGLGTVVSAFALYVFIAILAAMLAEVYKPNSTFFPILVILLSLVPFLQPFFVLLTNVALYYKWRDLGIPAGLFGIRSEMIDDLKSRNNCLQCGYDLRGNVSGICPECGRRAIAS